MKNRTTQRLIDQNVSRHLVTEKMAKEERLLEESVSEPGLGMPISKWGPFAGIAAVVVQLLAMMGL